jgi:hypothetical protein
MVWTPLEPVKFSLPSTVFLIALMFYGMFHMSVTTSEMDSALVRKSYHRPYLRLLGKKLIYR